MAKTFAQQADIYLAGLAARKTRPVKVTSLITFRSLIGLAKALIGNLNLEDIHDDRLKALVDTLCYSRYSPSSIVSLLSVVKLIVASDVDESGNPRHPRRWTLESVDAPFRLAKKETLRRPKTWPAVSM
jgi:hypothetical protein